MARTYNPTLDGIRGIAILAVLFTHSTGWFLQSGPSLLFVRPMGFGWSGVDLFFVLYEFFESKLLNLKRYFKADFELAKDFPERPAGAPAAQKLSGAVQHERV